MSSGKNRWISSIRGVMCNLLAHVERRREVVALQKKGGELTCFIADAKAFFWQRSAFCLARRPGAGQTRALFFASFATGAKELRVNRRQLRCCNWRRLPIPVNLKGGQSLLFSQEQRRRREEGVSGP
jgi:hypothetical protein